MGIFPRFIGNFSGVMECGGKRDAPAARRHRFGFSPVRLAIQSGVATPTHRFPLLRSREVMGRGSAPALQNLRHFHRLASCFLS